MKRIFALLQYIMRPAIAICLACLLVGPLLAAESAGEMKLQKARVALTREQKDTVQAKKLLLEIVEKDKDTLDSQSLCYVYVYLGYIEDRAGNRNEAIPWYQKALKIKDADRVQECATFGLEKPLTWIRHLDEGTEKISLESAPPVVVRTVPMAGGAGVDPALTEIRVTYSKPMQDDSWSWCIWNEENYPETIGKPRYLSDGCTCVLPVNLKPDKFYAIWLNNDKFKRFTDTNGKPAVPYLLTFRTGTSTGAGEQRLKALVENFFAHNYRDITARDTIEWGQVSTDDKGNSSIRCQYRAIWDKDPVTNNQVFTFDPQDKFVSVKDVATAASPTHP
jgi:RNA polymerase sigma-70 factor (ECF subfamily)